MHETVIVTIINTLSHLEPPAGLIDSGLHLNLPAEDVHVESE